MQSLNARCSTLLGIVVVFLGAACAVSFGHPQGIRPVDIWALPLRLGQWSGIELYVDNDVRHILETPAVLMREYRNGNAHVLLSVVYYRDSRVALHLPESCYSGQGETIVERGTENMGSFTANRFALEGSRGNQTVLYYFTTGTVRTASYGRMRWEMLKNKLLGRDRGCALVRLSCESMKGNASDLAALKKFADAIDAVLPKYLL